MKLQLINKFLHRVRIHGGEFDSSARAMNRAEESNLFQADLRIVRGSTFERKQMSTTIKRVALVAVAALGLGVVSVAPSSASVQAESLAVSATAVSTTAGTAGTVVVTHSYLGNAVADTVTATASIVKMPVGNSVLPTWSTTSTGTDAGSPNKTQSGLVASTGVSAGTTATYYSANYTLSFNPTVAGEYIIRVTPSGTGVAAKDITFTVAAKVIGWSTAFIKPATGSAAIADATVETMSAASTVAVARITVAQGYGTTAGLETATSGTDQKAVVVTTTKGLVSKTNDYSAAAKSVTTAAGTVAPTDYYVFSNGDVGVATISITVGTSAAVEKTVTFKGAATALVATPTSAAPLWATLGTNKTTTITATDAAATVVSIPTGVLTVTSSDTSVATVAINQTTGVVTVTPVAVGNTTITVTDPSTTGAAAAVSFPAHVAPVKSAAAPVISFDKTAYAVGELITMTITADMGDSATANLFTAALVLSSSVQAVGTAPTGTTHAVAGGKVTYTFYAPAVSGTFTVKGTTGADVALTTAAEVSKTVDITNTAVDAATDAANEAAQNASDATDAALAAADEAALATQAAEDAVAAVAELSAKVDSLIKALKAQITTLTKLVIKIQKKVKA